MSIYFNKIYVLVSILIILIFTNFYQGFSAENSNLIGAGPCKINLELHGQTLKNIILSLSDQTGYKVVVDSDWLNMPVSGIYKDIEIDSFFRRILRDQNISVLFNDQNKYIIVRAFGKKDYQPYIAGGDPDAIDQITGMKLTDINEIREMDSEVIKEYYSNPDSIDQMSGMTLGEISELREIESEALREYLENPESVDQLSGIKLSEIKKLREGEAQEIENYYSNPESVDQLSGMKLTEINANRERDAEAIREYYSNPDSIDQMSGMTLGEIAELREREKSM